MPINNREDKKGRYYQYGESGKKYYYHTVIGKERAYQKALRQAQAIKASENSQELS